MIRSALGPAAAAAVLVLAGCGGSKGLQHHTLTIAVNAPFSQSPAIGEAIAHGVELAVADLNAAGGLTTSKGVYTFKVVTLDNALSPSKAVANVRSVARRAAAIIDEGTGVDASWRIAQRARTPVCVVYQGGNGLIDPASRPNVFRVAPTDHGVAFRLAEYLIPKGLRIALLHDDSGYGQQGHSAMQGAFRRNPEAVAADIALPTTATDLAPQVVRARRTHATALLVWGRPATIAKVLIAARSSGWNVPVYTPASGEDPLVRQQLSDHPTWVDGLTFAAGRMTAEGGPGPFLTFAQSVRDRFGLDYVGVRTSAGQRVVQPPDYVMYPFDCMNVIIAAIRQVGSDDRQQILAALNQVSSVGANGDSRGFNVKNHEGVIDDDIYFARFRDMTYRPVEDDPLSASLPAIPQTG